MTSPSGAGNAVAGRSPRADDDDDVRDDDPKLRAMRAVWLTMRDEDPPERGMAELLAAARVTAEAMQPRPGLWQRLVAGLRRPPVLAFATVVVLVGGAAIVVGRDVEVPARSPADPGVVATPSRPAAEVGSAAPGEVSTVPSAMDERPAVGGSAPRELGSEPTRRAEDPAKAAAAVAGARRGGVGDGAVAAPAVPAPVAAKPGRKRSAASDAPAGADRKELDVGAADDLQAPVPRGTAAPAPHAPATGTAGKAEGARPPRTEPMRESPRSAGDLDGAVRPSSEESTATADTGEATKQLRVEPKAARPDKDDRAAPGGALAQLYQQCEAAARRGDCAAVRQLVDRIAKLDRGYRARLAKGSPVATCLTE